MASFKQDLLASIPDEEVSERSDDDVVEIEEPEEKQLLSVLLLLKSRRPHF